MADFPFKSLREWVSFLSERGELVHVTKEVDLRGDVSAICKELSIKGKKGAKSPAVMFENIRGYPGWRIFSGGMNTQQRRAWALGAPPDRQAFLRTVVGKLNSTVPPMQVGTGPCKEVKILGDDVDLMKIPVPFTGDYEGTPSITAGISHIRDLETGWQNIAVRRFGLKGPRTLTDQVEPVQQDAPIWGKYRRAGMKCPVAIAIGADPVSYMVSQLKEPVGVCEYDRWGAVTGTPLEVVKCETSDILVPANAEMIIEGELDPNRYEMDGPFPEFCGYYTTIQGVAHMDVKCITMRKDPIYSYFNMGLIPTEGNSMGATMQSIGLFKELSRALPGIIDVHQEHWLDATVKVDKHLAKAWPQFALAVGNYVHQLQAAMKRITVVDQDVEDISNPLEVLAMSIAKFQASKDVHVDPRCVGTALNPAGPWIGRWGWEDCEIRDYTEKMAPWDEGYKRGRALPPAAAFDKVRAEWASYGLDD